VASSVDAIPALPFDGHVERVAVEGYASLATADTLRVGSYLFALPRGAAGQALTQIEASPHVRIEAVVRGRQAIIERVAPAAVLPARPEPRSDPGREASDPSRAGASDRLLADPASDPAWRDGRGAMPPRPPGQAGFGPPQRPDRPDRPDRPMAPGPPERPAGFERPPLAGRGAIPDRPPRPDRVQPPPRP
jgi:hypothetical protein